MKAISGAWISMFCVVGIEEMKGMDMRGGKDTEKWKEGNSG